MKPLTICRATSQSLIELAPRVSADPLFARYALTPQALLASWQRALVRGDGLLVAEDGAGPQGLVWFEPHGAFGRGAYLRLLVVSQNAQARGVGRALLDAYERHCTSSTGGCFLLCSDFNAKAQAWYCSRGYREVGRLPGFVISDVTEIIFWKRL